MTISHLLRQATCVALSAALLLTLTPGCAPVVATGVIYAPDAPPPPRRELRAARPGPRFVWIPGRWAWRARPKRYNWLPGQWARLRHPYHHHWVPGHWVREKRGYRWARGHWR